MYSIVIRVHSVLCIMFFKFLFARNIMEVYKNERVNMINEEYDAAVGGKLTLSDTEIAANKILKHWKMIEINASSDDPEYFSFSQPLYTYKNNIENSKVFQIIRKMPKGAVLHVHNSLMLGADFILSLTYEDNLYACFSDNEFVFRFSDDVPKQPCSVKWCLLRDLRNSSGDIYAFDLKLKKHFAIYSEGEIHKYMDINSVWERFNEVHRAIKSIISYRPVREKFFYETLKQLYDDNVMYAEIRSGLSGLYELNGTVHDKMYLARLYERITNDFRKEYPDFFGVKLIVTRSRRVSAEKVIQTINISRQIENEMPHFFAGFDLVGQEDLGYPLIDFLPVLMKVKNDMNFFFHGGETNWYGSSSDQNLVDAILLGSKRIGHGYSLIKHPHLMEAIKKKGIAIEVNVISNLVLSLVSDVRNHPLAAYLANNLPIVLSSDDPGVWGAYPLSHDFYIAFMGVASMDSDLRMLKQLALNSIIYSALTNDERNKMFDKFYNRWNRFINEVISYFTP